MHWTRIFLLIQILNFLLFPTTLFAQEKTLHIAFVSPTEEEPAGLKALKLYLDDIDWRTHNGFKIELDYYVDNNNKTQAEAVAKQIIKDNRAILVIGHNYSSTSSLAGPIYAQNAIPAISYSATNPKVTLNNPWYFRTIFNDASQGSFLAYYALKNLNYDHISIIYEPDSYGSFLAQVFEENAYLNGAKRVQSFKLNMSEPDEFKYRELHAAITSNKEQAGLIFMATHSSEGIKLVKLLRDAGVKNPIMGPDAFYSTAFIHGFDDETKELNNPGYYTNGIFLSAPIVFDVANAEAQQLKRQYLEAYGELPDWASAYGYDTAKVLAAVVASSQGRFNHTASSLADRRKAVQRALAELNSPQNAVQGVTGLNYFDQNGDAVKPIFIAVLHDKRVVSGLSQYKDVPNVDEVTNLEQQLANGSIIELADRYMYKMSVVFTGVKLHHIRRIDTQQHTSELDFTLWFRYRGDFDPSTLEFSNSIDDISLPAPYMESESGNIRYKAFRIKGLFRNDFMDDIQRRGQISIGFALRNTEMDRNTLLYARDTKGIGLTGNTQLIDLVKHQVLSEEIAGWRVENASIFERSVNVDSLGLPQYINIRDASVPYSQFHYIVELKQTGFRLSDVLPESSTQVIAILSSLLFAFAFLPRYLMATRLKGNLPLLRIRWIVITLSTVMLLGASESWISQQMFPVLDVHFQKWILHAYDLAWWILPAILLVRAVNVFVWQTMQIQSGRPIPRVIQSLLAFVIYTLALFAIVAFVYNQKLTGLLATSGLLAMIIGLAIQMNLSNIFSGIALNLEHPFRVGDWVRIGDHEGQVIDINWRATRLLTRVKHVISIPNTPAADTAVINYSTKEGATRQILMVGIHPIHPMETVKPLLISAAYKHPSVLREPEPTCTFAGIKEGVALYRLIYSYSDYALMFQVEDEIWSRMIKNFKQAGINYVPPMQRIEMNKPKPDPFVYREKGDFISHAALFSGLPEEFHRTLTDKLNELHFNAGEMILDKDRHYHSLFIIRNGVAAILKENASGIPLEQQRLGIDDLINLELLYTDEPLSYTVQAVVDLTVLEIPESLLKELFRIHHSSYEIFEHNIQQLAEQQQIRKGKEIKDHSKISGHFAWLGK